MQTPIKRLMVWDNSKKQVLVFTNQGKKRDKNCYWYAFQAFKKGCN